MAPAEVVHALAPNGVLRAAINLGNSVLVQRDSAGSRPHGIAVALADELARRFDVSLELVIYDAAGRMVEAVNSDAWDVGFLAVDPKRLEDIVFTPPYLLIQGNFIVRRDSPVQRSADVDRPGARLSLGAGTAYELFLSRSCKSAELDRFPTTTAAFEQFLEGDYDATAAIKEVARKFVGAHPELRMIEDSFMLIEQAVAVPRAKKIAAGYLSGFIEELKSNGFVADALAQSGQRVALAPPMTPGEATL